VRICVVGAGAIGGLVGAQLAHAGESVTLVDIGAQLAALRRDGLTVIAPHGETRVVRGLACTDSFEEAGEQDLVLLAVKAQRIAEVAEPMRALLGPETAVVTLQNGLPWWYFHRHGGEMDGWRLESLDPDGRIERHLEPGRILGCVAYPAAALERPGVIRHLYGDRFPVGEPNGEPSGRARAVAELFVRAGFRSAVLDDVRAELWLKAVGAVAFNPISALARATMAGICRHPATRALAVELMAEAESVAARLGVTLRVPVARRLSGAEKVGEHKTSMLQDVEAGRSLEVEAILGSVIEVGRRLGVATPRLDTIYACCRLLDESLAAQRAARNRGRGGYSELSSESSS